MLLNCSNKAVSNKANSKKYLPDTLWISAALQTIPDKQVRLQENMRAFIKSPFNQWAKTFSEYLGSRRMKNVSHFFNKYLTNDFQGLPQDV